MAPNAFVAAAHAVAAIFSVFSFLLAPLASLWAALESIWELWDWLLLSALCPPLAVFAAAGFSLSVLASAYFYCHALFAWRFGVGAARAAALLARGGAPAALGVGALALGVPYKPRSLYCAAFLVAHWAVLAPNAGALTAALLAAAPAALLAVDVLGGA
jgi:hypothetical protein